MHTNTHTGGPSGPWARGAVLMRAPNWVRNTILWAGLIAPLIVGAILFVKPHSAQAVVWCGFNSNFGTIGPYSLQNWIDIYSEPGCAGIRSRYYEHWGNSTGTLNRISFLNLRDWSCGTLYYSVPIGADNTAELGVNAGWLPATSCGWQSDQNTRFRLTGYADVWRYINI
ncbi:MAG: hypothetical protein ACKVVT_08015 [Dehalococcoidia bacterium]